MNPHREDSYVTLQRPKNVTVTWQINSKCKPTWLENWSVKYNVEVPNAVWKKIFSLSSYLTLDSKLVKFFAKSLSYANDSYVSKFDKYVSIDCSVCQVKNSIIHLLVEFKKTNMELSKCLVL